VSLLFVASVAAQDVELGRSKPKPKQTSAPVATSVTELQPAAPEPTSAATPIPSIKGHALGEPLSCSTMTPQKEVKQWKGTFTGLRMSEIKGLRWEDYDGEILNIQRGVVSGIVEDVKTKTSRASVPVIKTLKTVLASHLALNSGDGYIFHGETNEPMRFENLARRDIIPVLEKKNIRWHGMHAFRRGLSSVLYDLVPEQELTVKHIMRHAVKDVTGKHYIKPSLERNREALELVEKEFLKLKPKLKL
jgi:integrase